jgi:hypothetical protein
MLTSALLLGAILSGMAAAGEEMPLTQVQAIPLIGVEGRIDHFAYDAKAQRLFMAALGNNTVEVIDLAAGKVVHRLSGLKEPQGVAFIPETREVVVANGDDGSVRFYDSATWRLAHTVDLKGDADNLRYDAARSLVYAGYGDGGIAVIDPATHLVTGTLPLAGHPEGFALDTDGPRLFVNVPDAHQVAVLDRVAMVPLPAWDLKAGYGDFFVRPHPRASANFPLALDATHHRAFVGCRTPACVLVFDTVAGQPVDGIPISGDCDDLFYDATAGVLLASCGDGFVDVIAQVDADHYRRLAQVPTATGARTSWWLPEARRLCVAVPHRRTQPAEVLVFALHLASPVAP